MFAFVSLLALTGLVSAVDFGASGPEWSTVKSAILAKSEQGSVQLKAFAAAVDPPTPEGFTLTFGPLNASNNAPGFMGFVLLDSYDTAGCASLCNARDFDSVGGLCQFFNIYQGLTSANKTTFTCSLYYLPTDNSTATNPGDATVSISASRGYRRTSAVPDGSFETFACTPPALTCSIASFNGWVGTSDNATVLDTAAISHDPALAHFGSGSISLGSISGKTNASGTETFKVATTVKGRNYALGLFHSNTLRNPTNASLGIVSVVWNGVIVDTITGAQNWTFHGYTLTAAGNDTLAFHGGKFPAFDFIDDVFLFLL
ncbi:hypothetical protein E1B28_011450 [Marasmius oreades]|uniref:Uncharacterized protein n=1 Tax=Marasmius oreades TaxID=181124 RepID=A0A9P7RUU8_9AGAR|nr:uncharacterized protein E1B28_011450 [Marasmius oreades]KAG7089800.1 hypothetical protein E1B28_011450 [Marasmius oreades]